MAEVTKEGEYKRSGVPQQILYGGMVAAREIIIAEAAVCLSRAVTIAVRYSAIRRQFGLNEKMQELQVNDFI
jgi:acyl-CoA oxidase